MSSKIVLISDDTDFFDYIKAKLELRKSDELFTFNFDEIPDKLHLLTTSVIIINSENSQEKTLELLNLLKNTPCIVSAYNEDEIFKRKCFREGVFDFITPLTSDSDFRARMIPALNSVSLLEKNKLYRDILVKNNIITQNNEVFTDYDNIIDKSLEKIENTKIKTVFAAIAPNEKTKFLLLPNNIETVILNNIRKNDILMNFAPNKYFLFLFDSDINSAQKLWEKINSQIQQKLYAGFVSVTNQKKRQLIDLALNKLHENINKEKSVEIVDNRNDNSGSYYSPNNEYSNFKMFKTEFEQKIKNVISPVFYQMQQKYSNKLMGVIIEQSVGDGYGNFCIKGKTSSSNMKITSPGFAKINIDITYENGTNNIDAKRITLEPSELEAGLLDDLLEQFISDYKNGG